VKDCLFAQQAGCTQRASLVEGPRRELLTFPARQNLRRKAALAPAAAGLRPDFKDAWPRHGVAECVA
jgi:hypothetical protein